ncbi:hypothetical protein GGU11DRAFT_750357 [Lentinula aff. detonsa]|nr:hypothetical protein GGU11DRAFT_750357 [Lentinula aff. detonsa]
MDPLLTCVPNRLMPAAPAGGTQKPLVSNSQERSERARRRNIILTNSPTDPLPLGPPSTQVETTIDPALTPSQTQTSSVRSNAPSPTSSVSSTLSDMSRNISGSGWVDMGSLKAGCQLLIPNPALDALEELWGYVITNLEDRDISDEATKKKEFLRCFAKWSVLKDTIAEISQILAGKAWIEVDAACTDPEDFTCRPFFDAIRDKILGKDWARAYDLKREKYVMLPDPTGFSKLVTLIEIHNRRLRGTMYHRSNEVLQALIIQKLPEKFRADLRDCKVSEDLPYADWKIACKDVEERRPPIGPSVAYMSRRSDSRPERPLNVPSYTGGATSVKPASVHLQSNTKTHRFPKLVPEQKNLLYRVEACFRCYNLFAGHLSNACPNIGPPSLSVPFRPLNENDIALATRIHTAAPNNSIPYELILKRNSVPNSRPTSHSVAAVTDRVALTELPNLDEPEAAPSFMVQPNNVAAFYGSRNIIHAASGADVYGSALSRGLEGYVSSSGPVRKPIAAMIPSRRYERDYYDEESVNADVRSSPSAGRRTRRRENSPVDSRRDSWVSSVHGVASRSRSGSFLSKEDGGIPRTEPRGRVGRKESAAVRDEDLSSDSGKSAAPATGTRARSAPSVSVPSGDDVLMPFVLPHLEWQAKIIGPLGSSVQKLETCSPTPTTGNVISNVGW